MSKGEPTVGLDAILPRVERPGRYTGGEWNQIRKDPAQAAMKVALAFPDVYEIGMSYLGQKILYGLLNARPDVLAERVFAPWPDFERLLRERREPLRSLENKLPLDAFDVIGFSLLYELNGSNILTILDLGGIPLLACDRDENHPLVIGGGPAAFNPEPLADFFDLFLVGDGEEAFPEILTRLAELKRGGAGRRDVLAGLARIPGVYVPRFYDAFRPEGSALLAVRPNTDVPAAVSKRLLRGFARSYFPADIAVPNIQTVFDRVAVEVARGCPQKCRFCQATSLYAPYRVKDPAFVVDCVLDSVRSTGYEDASLFSLSVGDYPYLAAAMGTLMNTLEKDHVSLSLSSLRPKSLSADIVREILRVRKTGFTLVPEAGTERLRAVINKALNEQDISEAAAHALREGWRLLKLYFMIGLPTERDEDLEGIVALVARLSELGRSIMGGPPRINMSVSSFIPKPHTPFQWMAMAPEASLREKQEYLRRRFGRAKHVQIKDHPVDNSVLEAIFSRGDRRLSGVLLAAWASGARFDSWRDHFRFPLWTAAFEKTGVDPGDYLGPLNPDAILPWDHIRTGLHRDFLRNELRRALDGLPSPSCLETSCGRCRGCDFPSVLDRDFPAELGARVRARDAAPGRSKDAVRRYELHYAKRGPVRYVSHNDLVNILQRTFKRAGVSVVFSQGFHPKMQMSLVPALPLGMTSNDEALEFKSVEALDETACTEALRGHAPAGLDFSGLKTIAADAPSLTERMSSMVYSLDLDNPEVRAALSDGKTEGGLTVETIAARLVEEFRPSKPDLLRDVFVDADGRKVVFEIDFTPRTSLRVQDVVERMFGLPRAVHLLTREKINFRPT